MARVLVTGSTTGLGKAAAQQLLDDGHHVVLHGRNPTRIAGLGQLARRAAGVVIGDLADAGDTRAVADQANALGGIDAVIRRRPSRGERSLAAQVTQQRRKFLTGDADHVRNLPPRLNGLAVQ